MNSPFPELRTPSFVRAQDLHRWLFFVLRIPISASMSKLMKGLPDFCLRFGKSEAASRTIDLYIWNSRGQLLSGCG